MTAQHTEWSLERSPLKESPLKRSVERLSKSYENKVDIKPQPMVTSDVKLKCVAKDCDTICSDKKSLNQHMETDHNMEFTTFRCDFKRCKKVFKAEYYPRDYERHRFTHSED